MDDKEKCCGACCWFLYEDTDGCGQCVVMDVCDAMHCSDLCTTDKFVSRKEMRHHMAVLLQYHRWLRDWITVKRDAPDKVDLMDASEFAYKYMKVFSKL